MYTARFYLFSYYTDKNYTYFFSNISIFLICNNLSGIEQEKNETYTKGFHIQTLNFNPCPTVCT